MPAAEKNNLERKVYWSIGEYLIAVHMQAWTHLNPFLGMETGEEIVAVHRLV